jgi:uncharacterized protein (TIGR02145 family)
MKYNRFWLLLCISFFISCNPDPVTKPVLHPEVTTTEVKYVTQHTATCCAVVTSGGESDAIGYGLCWSASPHPTIADNVTGSNLKELVDFTSPVDFTAPIGGLTGSTTYYVRAFAVNVNKFPDGGYYPIGETIYGNEYKFTTDVETPTVTDADGNVYHTIQIGTQLWMLENLRTTKYNDGTDIPIVKGDIGEIFDLLSPHYFFYYYNPSNKWYNPLNKNTIGVLYNGYAVTTGKLAPIGWHVPSINDWIKLSDYLGGDSISGAKLKSANTSELANHVSFICQGNWMPPNTGAINSSGFSALPGGYYDNNNDTISYDVTDPNTYGFKGNGYFGHWWSSTEDMPNSLYSIALNYMQASTYFSEKNATHSKRFGFSVRCVKN